MHRLRDTGSQFRNLCKTKSLFELVEGVTCVRMRAEDTAERSKRIRRALLGEYVAHLREIQGSFGRPELRM
jgi:hypothetical protein